jgi:hypothetical protein
MRITTTVAALTLLAGAAVAASPGPAELARLTPADATVVVGVNVAALRSYPAVQEWLVKHPAPWNHDHEADEFLRDAGLDPLRDVNASVFSVIAGSEGHNQVLALLSGAFDPSSLAAAMVKRGATEEETKPFRFLRLEQHEHGQQLYAGITPDIVAVGDPDGVRAALSGSLTGSTLVTQEVAAGHLDTRAGFWMVMNVPERVREGMHAHEGGGEVPMHGLAQAARALQRITVQATLGTDLVVKGYARADTPENAELVHDAIKGAIAAFRLGAQETHPELVDVLRGVDVDQDGSVVTMHASVPASLLEQLASKPK